MLTKQLLQQLLCTVHIPGRYAVERFFVGLLRAVKAFTSAAFVLTWSKICENALKNACICKQAMTIQNTHIMENKQ